MPDVLVIHPVKPVARWIAGILSIHGHCPAVAHDLDEANRLMQFVRFPIVIAWLPSADLGTLADTLKSARPFRPSALIMSWTPATLLAAEPWFLDDIDDAIPLPTSSSAVLKAVRNACLLGMFPHRRLDPIRHSSRQSARASNYRSHLPTRTKSGRQPSSRHTMGT